MTLKKVVFLLKKLNFLFTFYMNLFIIKNIDKRGEDNAK